MQLHKVISSKSAVVNLFICLFIGGAT